MQGRPNSCNSTAKSFVTINVIPVYSYWFPLHLSSPPTQYYHYFYHYIHTMDSTLIIGAGIFGISTAYHLALKHPNAKITILDRCPAPSAPAASTDLNKIVRADYSNPLYMNLGFEAISAWKELPFFKNANVYHQTGWIMMDEKDSDLAERIQRNFQNSGRNEGIADLTEEEVRNRWGGILKDTNCDEFGRYYYNKTAGWADAGTALQIMAEEAVKMGVEYKVGDVMRVLIGEIGVRGVETASGEIFTADKVLLCTGAWTSSLMSSIEDELGIPDSERIENQVTAAGVCVAHFQLTEEEKEVYGQLPVFVYGGHGTLSLFSLPCMRPLTKTGEVIPPTASGIFKFTSATSFKNTVVTPSEHSISVPPEGSQLSVPTTLQDELIDQVRARIPQMLDNGRQVDYFRLCWDSISPNQQPLITRHPDATLRNLYFAVGGSFHCWKFLPVIGRYIANVLEGVSNGEEKDQAWSWKTGSREERGVHEKVMPRRELKDC